MEQGMVRAESVSTGWGAIGPGMKTIDESKNSIRIDVHDTFEELSGVRDEWDALVEFLEGEIFLTYDWCRIWWKYYGRGRELKIMMFRNDEGLVGLLPLFVDSYGPGFLSTRVVKLVGTDFMPVAVSIPIKQDCIEKVTGLFHDALNRHTRWDLIHFGAVSGKYTSVKDLARAFAKASRSCSVEVTSRDVHTYFSVADSWNEQLARLKGKQRQNVHRAYRSVAGRSISARFASEDDWLRFYEEFVDLHQRAWRNAGAAGHFLDWPFAYEFHKEVAAHQLRSGRLRLLKVDLGNKCLGYKYGYRCGNTYYQYLSARNGEADLSDIGFNQISFGEQVKKAIEEGVQCIDSMRGEYPHKMHLGGRLMPIHNLYVFPKKNASPVKVAFLRRFARILDVSYQKLWRRRIAARLGFTPGTFNRLWIRTHPLSS